MRGKADSDLVRRQNRHLVLETLRLRGPLPRIEIVRLTRLSAASITAITLQLIEEGTVQELDGGPAKLEIQKRGRPTVTLGLRPDAALVVAIKIAIDCLELALADFSGVILHRKLVKLATYKMSPLTFSQKLVAETQKFVDEAQVPAAKIVRIGVAAQGVADARRGAIAWSPAFETRGIPVVQPLREHFQVPCTLANDANMIAEGLIVRHQLETRGTTAVVFMSYGVGMGLVIDGVVYQGSSGAGAEFGHMNHVPGGALCRCGRAGCLEAYASDYGILRSAEDLPDSTVPPSSAVDPFVMLALEKAARNGNAKPRAAFEKAGRAIGFGLARMIALLTPDRIVLAGVGIRALDLIEPALRAAIDEGVVAELRQNLLIETVPLGTDMIVEGTLNATLRHLDSAVFAAGPRELELPDAAFYAQKVDA